MSRDALVVDRRCRVPQRERLLASHGEPDLSRACEVLARRGVVADVRTTHRSGHRLAASQRRGDLEVGAVQLVDGSLDQLLAPGNEAVGTVDRTIWISLELVDALVPRRTRGDLLDQLGDA